MLVLAITANFWQVTTFDMTNTFQHHPFCSCIISYKLHWNPSIVDFFVKAKLSTIEGFSTNEGVLCGEKSICQA